MTQGYFKRSIRSVKSAAIAGVLYSILAIAALLLLRSFPSAGDSSATLTAWIEDPQNQVGPIIGLSRYLGDGRGCGTTVQHCRSFGWNIASPISVQRQFADPTSRPVAVTDIDGVRVHVFDTGFQRLSPAFKGTAEER